MAKQYIPGHSIVTCDRCGETSPESVDTSEGWDPNFTYSHFRVNIDGKSVDLCYKCNKAVQEAINQVFDFKGDRK